MIQLSLAQARELAESILLHNGFNPAHARAVSDTVLAGERDGCASHGLYRLSGCVNSLRAGKAIPEGWGGMHRVGPVLMPMWCWTRAQCSRSAGTKARRWRRWWN